MLKPIPQEQPGKRGHKKKNKKQGRFMRLEITIRDLKKADRQLYDKVCEQLLQYVKKDENVSLDELNDLIHDLQRTTLSLQKKRIKIITQHHNKRKKN